MSTLICFHAGTPDLRFDPKALRLEVDLNHVQQSGANIECYSFTEHPDKFAQYPQLLDLLSQGNQHLPIIMVDDKIVSQGSYPTREQLATWAGVKLVTVGGCGGGSCTCGGG